MSELFSVTHPSGVEEKFSFDKSDEKLIIQNSMDVSSILAANREEAKLPQKGFFRKVASIPLPLWRAWENQGHDLNDQKVLFKLLNSNEFKLLRTHESVL